jgi:benzoyl-CoA reductase/2-hydroxyglutaryl-CoA dehydratase subunit BcrC/BadD/HgdB
MMLSVFENVARGIEARLAQAGPDEMIARKRLTLESARLGVRLFSGREPVAWCGVPVPFDVLNAMGVTSCFAEFVGASLASAGSVAPFLEVAEQAGFSTDGCSYHRSVLGATVQGLMPEPEILIGASTPCAGGLAVIENLAAHFSKPLFVIHVPARRDEAAVEHLSHQLRDMVAFVTEHTGRSLDPERLREAMELTNRARQVLLETYRLAASVPTPARRRDLINLALVIALSFGTEAAVEVAETYRDEFARKVRDGVAGVAAERARLMWIQNRIQFKSPVEEILEQEYGAAVVADELNEIGWDAIDPDDPFPGLARRILSIPICGPIDYRIERLRKMAADYRLDGAINPCHWGCRQGTGGRGLLERGLKDVGVPVLNLEVDCIDERNFALGQIKTRLGAFMEMIHDRRTAAGTAPPQS